MKALSMTSAFLNAGIVETSGNRQLAETLTDPSAALDNPAQQYFASGGYAVTGIQR